jgi:excinuclease ABC subunit A
LLKEITARLKFLYDVGVGYLQLARSAATLSGGESQRIRLARQIGTELTGVLYVLDEPSIGLHPRDNRRLVETLSRLRDIGNTVLVVEHDAETILAADHVVDFGPGAGTEGGRVVAQGTPAEICANDASLTGAFLSGRRTVASSNRRRSPRDWVVVREATAHNLKGVDVHFPLGVFTVVTGVSGAGKSTLVEGILKPALARKLSRSECTPGAHAGIDGMEYLDKIIAIDQRPIGRTPRSNPATYTKVLDAVRKVLAQTKEARMYGYQPGRFSFNVKGGRCEACKGDGVTRVEMHFLPDVYVTCEVCRGLRFNEATLRVRFKGYSISDILKMTVLEALTVFENHPRIRRILQTLVDVGLGYLALGQPSNTLSGGEAQRVKLSRELARVQTGRTLYILDEPSTGLHFADVERLLAVIDRLVEAGNSVVMVEHHLDIIGAADHVIDLGPDGGEDGGRVVAAGTPEEVSQSEESHTGRFLRTAMQALG